MKKLISDLFSGLLVSVLLIMNVLAQNNVLQATDGNDLIQKMGAASSGDRILLSPNTTYELPSNLTLKNGVKIIGASPNHSSVIKILPGGQLIMDSNSELWNCKITREIPTSGTPTISLAITTNGQNIRIEKCSFEKNRTAIYINPGATNLQINKNNFFDNRTGIVVPGGGGNNISGLQITGNNLSNNRSYGIIFSTANSTPDNSTPDFSIDATLTGNNIVNNRVSGIGIDNNNSSTSIKLRNNWFGNANPTIYNQTLNGKFEVSDHTTDYVDTPYFSNNINYDNFIPSDISGIHTDKIHKFPSLPTSVLLHAASILNNTFAAFSPISIGTNAYYTTIQDAINNSINGNVINVPDGIYDEDVNINKEVTINGTSRDNTIIRGLFSGSEANTVIIGANATIANLTVTRDYGSTTEEWTSSVKSQGITVTGNGVTIDGVKVIGNRNGVYINNNQNFTIKNNLVTNNRTGLQLANNVNGGKITNNDILENYTHGLMLNFDLGNINATDLIVKHNNFADNWYSEIYFHGTNNGTFTNSDFSCNNYNTVNISKNASAANEPPYNNMKPPFLGGIRPASPAHILRGTKVNELKHSPWLNNYADASPLPGYQLPTAYSVSPASGTYSASNNDFRVLANAIGCAVDGDQITLTGNFDYTETNSSTEWAKGVDGDVATTTDNYTISVKTNLSNIQLSGPATITGPGDIAAANLESFISFGSGNNPDWKISGLTIKDFDLSIGFMNISGDKNNLEIFNNTIYIPKDITDDASQNIGIHMTRGKNQKIYNNTFYVDGTGVGVDVNTKSSTIVMQSYSSGAQHTDGLMINDNNIIVTGKPHASEPAYIVGIWENAGSTNASVEIFNNKFSNADSENLPQNNRQLAFRVTSRSGNDKTVSYHHNEINGFNRAIDWLGDPFSIYTPSSFNTGAQPVLIQNNKIENVKFGVTPRKATASTNPNAPAIINNNSFTNLVAGGYAVGYDGTGELNASCNYWDTDIAMDVKSFTSGTGNIRVMKFLNDGGSSGSIGFTPTGECVAPVRRVAPEEFFASIQEGIDDSETTNSHELEVQPGSYAYPATILVNKSLKISGIGATKPQLSFKSGATITNKSHIYITVPSVTINNLDIQVAGEGDDMIGIMAGNSGTYNNLVINNNTITNLNPTTNWNTYGILAGSSENSGSDNVTISNNTIGAFGRGIRLVQVNGVVGSNTINGIHALSTANYGTGAPMTITENNFYGSVNMIESNGSTHALNFTDNIFDGSQTLATTGDPFYLLQIRENSNTTPVFIADNQFRNHKKYGVFVARSGNVSINNNVFNPDNTSTSYTNIAWNSKSETSATNPTATASEIFNVNGNTFTGNGGKDISFANHNSGSVTPLSGISIGSSSHPNLFNGTPAYYVYLDNQTGSTDDETDGLWTGPAFGSAKPTTMAPFNELIYVGNNQFGGSPALAATLPFADISPIETKIFDKDDETSTGQVYVQMPVRNINDNTVYLTIQEGIDAAATGNTLEVMPYTLDHSTTILVNKSLTIQGQDNGSLQPVLTGTGDATNKSRFIVSVSDVTIKNIEIRVNQSGNDITGIKANNTGGKLTLTKNNIVGLSTSEYPVWNSFGIDVGNLESGSFTDISMTENTIETFGRAARLTRTRGLVEKNTLKGIYSLNAAAYSVGGDLTVEDNDFTGSVNMIANASSGNEKLIINNNDFLPIPEASGSSFYLLQIRDNNNDKPAVVSNNRFNNHETFGLFLGRSGNVTVETNTFNPKANSTGFTHIGWNSKNETSANNPPPYAAENIVIADNQFQSSGVAGGTGISFSNHNSGAVPALKGIVVGENARPNTFASTLGNYIYLDESTGSSSTHPIWTSPAFSSAKPTNMAPFTENIYAGYNIITGNTDQAYLLNKTNLLSIEDHVYDKDDNPLTGQVYFRSVWNSVKDSHHASIQDAVNAADDNDDLIAYGWEYIEDVDVNKSVTIKGDNLDDVDKRPVVKNTAGTQRFIISKPNVTIENFRIEVSESGTDMTGIKTGIAGTYNNLTIKNNVIANTATGVWGSYGIFAGSLTPSNVQDQITLQGNSITNFGRGARLERTNGLIENNTFEGIYALNVAVYAAGNNLSVQNNQFYGSVSMVGGNTETHQLSIANNTFDASQTDTNPFYLLQVRDNGNQKPVNIQDNSFMNHTHYGVFIAKSGNVTINQNTFSPSGNSFSNIGWNSKSETSAPNPPALAAEGFTVTNNTFNGTGGNGITFANHNAANGIVPLAGITLGTETAPNIFSESLSQYILLDNASGNSNTLSLWNSGTFNTTSISTMVPFNVAIFGGNNKFGDGSSPLAHTLGYSAIQTIEGKVADKDDQTTLGQVFFKTPVHNITQTKSYQTIQEAVNEANPNDKISLDEWQYFENVTVAVQGLTIQGTGNITETILQPLIACTGNTGSNGVTVNSSHVTLKTFTIQNFLNGVVANGSNLTVDQAEILNNCYNGISILNGANHLTVTSSKVNQNRYGLQVGSTVTANNLTIANSQVKGNSRIGLVVEKGNGSTSTFNDVQLLNTDFSDNQEKGIYLEKANNLMMDGLLVNNCGTTTEQYLVNQGIDINLKYGSFSSITLKNSTITNSGAQGHATTHAYAPAAMSIKARNDGSYSSNPATLNNVMIENNIIHGLVHGLRIGEYNTTVNTGPTNVTIQNNAFTGTYSGKALINTTSAIPNANCNWWGVSNITAIQAKTEGSVFITTFLSSANNSATGYGFIPQASCAGATVDYALGLLTGTISLPHNTSTDLLIRIQNLSSITQSEDFTFAVFKMGNNFQITFDENTTSVTVLGSISYNVENASEHLEIVEENSVAYIFKLKAGRVLSQGNPFMLGLKIKSITPSKTSSSVSASVSAGSEDISLIDNNSATILISSN